MSATGSDGSLSDAVIAVDVLDTDRAGPGAIRGGAVRVVGFAVTVLISVGSSALLFRHLGHTRLGDYAKVVSLVTLCGGFTDAGLSAIGVRELASRDAEGRRALIRSLGGLRLVLAAAGVLIAVGFAALARYGATLVLATAVVGAAMIATVLQDTYAITLTAQLRISWLAAADLVRIGVLALGILALVLAGAGLFPFYIAMLPAAIAAALLTAWLVHREIPLRPSFEPKAWRGLLGDTLTFSLATAVIAVYFRVALIVVSLVANSSETGYFAAAFRVVEVLISVPALLVGVAFPIFARAARDDRVRLAYAVGRVFDSVWLVGLGVALALVVGAPFVLSVLGGTSYGPAGVVLRIQGIAMVATFVGSVWAYTLLSLHRHREILVVSLVALALTLALTASITALDGARGAAIGTTIAEYAFVLMMGAAVYRSGIRPAITWAAVPKSLVAAGLGVATLAIPHVADVVRLVAAMAVYAVTLLALRAVPSELIAELPWRRG
jgi:O-antigen/teichoic acid export membrane protein